MIRNFSRIRIFFLVSIVIFLFSACGENGCSGLFRSKKAGVPVMAEKVKVEESSPVVTVKGALIPSDKADVSFPNDIKIQDVFVNVGDSVLKGDPLLRFAEDEINNDLNFARIRRTELEALLDKNNNILKSREKLLEEGKIDQNEITRLEKEIAAEEAELERLKAEINKYTYNLEHATITSPMSGMVIKREVNQGSTARAGETLLSIVNINPINISFPLDAKQAADVSIDMPLNIFIDELPGEKFTSKITYISPEIHRVDKTFEVWASLPNDDMKLKAGMNASTEFVSDTMHETYIIPLSSVLSKTTRPFVFKVEKGVARKTPVVIGSINGGTVEIIRGLEANDIVVVKGGEDLYDGAEVDIWR